MTAFHEQIRIVLADVDRFLNDGLQGVKLPKKANQDKTNILEALHTLFKDYPQISPAKKEERDVSDGSVKTSNSGFNDDEDDSVQNYPLISARELTSPVKSGILDKRRKKDAMVFKDYQKRYCVIQGNVFYYFKEQSDKKQCGAFCIVGYEFRPCPDKVKDQSKKHLGFELVAPTKRTFEFLADTEEEFESWREAIKTEAIDEEIYEAIGEAEAPVVTPVAYRKPPSIPPPETPTADPTSDKDFSVEKSSSTFVEEDYADAKTIGYEAPQLPPARNTPISKPTMAPPSIPEAAKAAPVEVKHESPVSPVKKNIMRPAEDFENMFYGKWNCKADKSDELSFQRGDIIHIINYDYDKNHWWVGEFKGAFGFVPKEYLTKAYELVCA